MINRPHKAMSIHRAVRKRDLRALLRLLKWGFDINLPNKFGNTPIHLAAYYNIYFSDNSGHSGTSDICAVTKLIEHKANVNVANALMQTPLHYAVLNKSYTAATALIENGASIYAVNIHNINALWYSIQNNCYPIMVKLVEKGAFDSPVVCDSYKEAIFEYAAELKRYKMLDVLIEYGAKKEWKYIFKLEDFSVSRYCLILHKHNLCRLILDFKDHYRKLAVESFNKWANSAISTEYFMSGFKLLIKRTNLTVNEGTLNKVIKGLRDYFHYLDDISSKEFLQDATQLIDRNLAKECIGQLVKFISNINLICKKPIDMFDRSNVPTSITLGVFLHANNLPMISVVLFQEIYDLYNKLILNFKVNSHYTCKVLICDIYNEIEPQSSLSLTSASCSGPYL